jgi:deazaflavin-dependent oxidoreductase (nitroreductase family)
MASSPPGRAPGDEDFCYLTTTGRVSGRPHRIEIWFALDGATAYLLSGGGQRADWVRNLARTPSVTFELAGRAFDAHARVVVNHEEQRRARQLVFDKYRARYSGSLESWRDGSVPVAVDLPEVP